MSIDDFLFWIGCALPFGIPVLFLLGGNPWSERRRLRRKLAQNARVNRDRAIAKLVKHHQSLKRR